MATEPLPPAPIPTFYRGHTFRSKLEAKWALTLDRLRVKWDYEPQARKMKPKPYLPDFYLPDMKGGTWLEVKPFGLMVEYVGHEDGRWVEYARQQGQDIVVVFGLPDPYVGNREISGTEGTALRIFGFSGDIDYDYHLTACAVCGTLGFEYMGYGARACNQKKACYGRLDIDRRPNWDDPQILSALAEARQAWTGIEQERSGRKLTDAEVLAVATNVRTLTANGSSPLWHLPEGIMAGDREAVLKAWGRLDEEAS